MFRTLIALVGLGTAGVSSSSLPTTHPGSEPIVGYAARPRSVPSWLMKPRPDHRLVHSSRITSGDRANPTRCPVPDRRKEERNTPSVEMRDYRNRAWCC